MFLLSLPLLPLPLVLFLLPFFLLHLLLLLSVLLPLLSFLLPLLLSSLHYYHYIPHHSTLISIANRQYITSTYSTPKQSVFACSYSPPVSLLRFHTLFSKKSLMVLKKNLQNSKLKFYPVFDFVEFLLILCVVYYQHYLDAPPLFFRFQNHHFCYYFLSFRYLLFLFLFYFLLLIFFCNYSYNYFYFRLHFLQYTIEWMVGRCD